MRYLLDANILSDLRQCPGGRVADKIGQSGDDQVGTSIIVVAELRYGIAKIRSRRLTAQFAAILGGIEVFGFDAPADAIYGTLRAELERSGLPIGANDLLIAAPALALRLTLVTGNERELSRVPNLRVENWLG